MKADEANGSGTAVDLALTGHAVNGFQQVFPAQMRCQSGGTGVRDGNPIKAVFPIQPAQSIPLKSAQSALGIVQDDVARLWIGLVHKNVRCLERFGGFERAGETGAGDSNTTAGGDARGVLGGGSGRLFCRCSGRSRSEFPKGAASRLLSVASSS